MKLEQGKNMTEEKTYCRMSFNNTELKFLLLVLRDYEESTISSEQMFKEYAKDHLLKNENKEYRKSRDRQYEMMYRRMGLKNLIHRFNDMLSGGCPRGSKYAEQAMSQAIEEEEKKCQQN